jgi:small subunit ribosomal protein S9
MARRKKKVVLSRGKRKEAIARASVKEGKGNIRINGLDWRVYFPQRYHQMMIEEVLTLAPKKFSKVDIDINVQGGGVSGQLQAVRRAMATGLVEYYGDEKLLDTFYDFDRSLIVEDVRRVEPKKDRQRKARAKFQKSYR